MSAAGYRRGLTGMPVPAVGGVSKAGRGGFRKPAAGWALLERVPAEVRTIIAPNEEAEASFAAWKIIEVGSTHYVPSGTGATLPFAFEAGDVVVLRPNQVFADGRVNGPILLADPSAGMDKDGRPMRVGVQMHEIVMAIDPPKAPGVGDA